MFNKKKRDYFIFFTFVVVVLLLIINLLNQELKKEVIDKVNDHLSTLLRKQLDQEKSNALRFALVLSQNESLIQALSNDDEEEGYRILSDLMKVIKEHTNDLVRTQIISNEFTIFARSWDNSFAGMPIDEYRPDLNYFQKNKKPRSAIELGRRLGFKATVPIYRSGKRLGFVEVLRFFETPTEYFKNIGVDFFVLMDDRFSNIAIFMQNNPTVGPYVIANRLYNKTHFNQLKEIDFKTFEQIQILKINDRYFFYKPMLNGEGEKIGAFIFVISKEYIKHFAEDGNSLSFMLDITRNDLYEIVKKKTFDEKLFQNRYDNEIIYLKDIVAKEDKELFLQEAYDRFNTYSKEELISLLLNHNYTKKIEGKIR